MMKFAEFMCRKITASSLHSNHSQISMKENFELGFDSDGNLPYWDPTAEFAFDEHEEDAMLYVV